MEVEGDCGATATLLEDGKSTEVMSGEDGMRRDVSSDMGNGMSRTARKLITC